MNQLFAFEIIVRGSEDAAVAVRRAMVDDAESLGFGSIIAGSERMADGMYRVWATGKKGA